MNFDLNMIRSIPENMEIQKYYPQQRIHLSVDAQYRKELQYLRSLMMDSSVFQSTPWNQLKSSCIFEYDFTANLKLIRI